MIGESLHHSPWPDRKGDWPVWPFHHRLRSRRRSRFPAGLKTRLEREAPVHGVAIRFHAERIEPVPKSFLATARAPGPPAFAIPRGKIFRRFVSAPAHARAIATSAQRCDWRTVGSRAAFAPR